MFASVSIAFALALNGWALAAESTDQAFQREATIKLLGYDPESSRAECSAYPHHIARFNEVVDPKKTPEETVVLYLKFAGELEASRTCPSRDLGIELSPLAKADETLTPSVCIAAANAAAGELTEKISNMMNSEHPDVVASYVQGVAQALQNVRDACIPHKEAWAKVATQALLFENRATSIRNGRVCALWRMALDKELKAATAAGDSKGRAAGVTYFETRANAALRGAHHYCADDSTSSLVDANVDLTKMLIDSMPEK